MMGTKQREDPYEQALRQPRSRKLAIRAKCWDCEGQGADPGWQQRIRTCVVEDCPLWHVRPYQTSDTNTGGSPSKTTDYRPSTEQGIDSGVGVETAVGGAR